MVLLAVLALVALLSHLLIVSRTARAVVLLPMLALPLAATGLNPVALILLIVAGSGFCQTFAISAKPVALFARSETVAERVVTRRRFDRALLKLALALLPVMLALLLAFAVWIWPALGLPLLHAAAA
jgi:solute carrier family 13 (sodium-dependent dicarboxylate transporter), member 2/3/5